MPCGRVIDLIAAAEEMGRQAREAGGERPGTIRGGIEVLEGFLKGQHGV